MTVVPCLNQLGLFQMWWTFTFVSLCKHITHSIFHTDYFVHWFLIPKFIICCNSSIILTGPYVVLKNACLNLLKWKIPISILLWISIKIYCNLSIILWSTHYRTEIILKFFLLVLSTEDWLSLDTLNFMAYTELQIYSSSSCPPV